MRDVESFTVSLWTCFLSTDYLVLLTLSSSSQQDGLSPFFLVDQLGRCLLHVRFRPVVDGLVERSLMSLQDLRDFQGMGSFGSYSVSHLFSLDL